MREEIELIVTQYSWQDCEVYEDINTVSVTSYGDESMFDICDDLATEGFTDCTIVGNTVHIHK